MAHAQRSVRTPATKFPHLRKKMEQAKLRKSAKKNSGRR